MNRNHRKQSINLFWIYTTLFIVTAVITYAIFVRYRRTLVTFADGYNESLPVFIYTGRYFRTLFHHITHDFSIPLYDFTIGFGEDIAGALSWEGFGDPFTLISVFTPSRYAAYGFSLMALLKYYAAGVAFLYCCRKTGIEGMTAAAASLSYAFCGFALYYGGIFYTFTSALIYFPLYILGVRNIVLSDKNAPVRAFSLLGTSVFLLSLSGFYYLYMNTVIGGLYFLILYFQRRQEQNRRSFLCLAGQVVLQYLTGMAMAAGILFPTINEYLISKRQGSLRETMQYLLQMPDVSSMKQTLANLVMPDYENGLGFCILTITFLILLFLQKRRYTAGKIMMGILLAGLFIPGFGSIMNGFSYSISRWDYMLYFGAIYYMARLMQDHQSLDKVERIAALITVICTLLCCLLFSVKVNGKHGEAFWLRFIVYGVMALFCLLVLYQPRMPRNALALLLIGNVIIGSMWFYTDRPGGYGFVRNFRGDAVRDVTGSVTAALAWEQESDEHFSRIDVYDASLASSLILNVPTASSYYSMSNGNIYDFFSRTGISSGIRGMYFCLRGLDGRKTTESLLSVRAYTKNDAGNDVVRVPHEDRLPMGIAFDNVITEEEADTLEAVTVSSSLLDTLIIGSEVSQNGEIPHNRYVRLPYKTVEEGIICNNNTGELKTQKEAVCRGIINNESLDTGRDYEYYLLLRDFRYQDPATEMDIDINGRSIQLKGTTVAYHIDSDDYLVLLNTDGQNPSFNITFPDAGTFTLSGTEILAVDVTDLGNRIRERQIEAMTDTVIGVNSVSGSIDTKAGNWYFFSIPWSEDWHCCIDGERAESVRADYGFSAVYVPAGSHDINFRYQPAYAIPMFAAMAAGWGIGLFSLLRRRER